MGKIARTIEFQPGYKPAPPVARDEEQIDFDALTAQIGAIRFKDEDLILVGFGVERLEEPIAHFPQCLVHVTLRKKDVTVSSSSVSLKTALYMARGEIEEQTTKKREQQRKASLDRIAAGGRAN